MRQALVAEMMYGVDIERHKRMTGWIQIHA